MYRSSCDISAHVTVTVFSVIKAEDATQYSSLAWGVSTALSCGRRCWFEIKFKEKR